MNFIVSYFFQGFFKETQSSQTALHFLWSFLRFRFFAMEKGQIRSLNITIFCELLECDLKMTTSTTLLWITQALFKYGDGDGDFMRHIKER